jgi:catechol-2,3-dioxygenase
MNIQELTLVTRDLSTQQGFYRNVLKLPVIKTDDDHLTVQAGQTKLTFVRGSIDGVYHFAFNIPENQFAAALKWLPVPLIKASDGKSEFFSEGWNANMFYFYDPAGNILELIARHTLANASDQPFSEKSLLNISEIGVAVSNVNAFTESSGLPYYLSHVDEFAPIGDENGLLIVVKIGREWFPNTGRPALELPLQVVFSSEGKQMQIDAMPNAVLHLR